MGGCARGAGLVEGGDGAVGGLLGVWFVDYESLSDQGIGSCWLYQIANLVSMTVIIICQHDFVLLLCYVVSKVA